jgi:hypothetical protein
VQAHRYTPAATAIQRRQDIIPLSMRSLEWS